MCDECDEPEELSWHERARLRVLNARERLRRRITRSITRFERWWPDTSPPEPLWSIGGARYLVSVTFSSGGTVQLEGQCSDDQAERLTGFASMRGRPAFPIVVSGGVGRVDTSKPGASIPGPVYVMHGGTLLAPMKPTVEPPSPKMPTWADWTKVGH